MVKFLISSPSRVNSYKLWKKYKNHMKAVQSDKKLIKTVSESIHEGKGPYWARFTYIWFLARGHWPVQVM